MSISRSFFDFCESSLELFKWAVFSVVHENPVNYIKREDRTRPVAILGNGPSLKEFRPEPGRDSDYCMVNFAPLSELFFSVKPAYHVLVDDAFFVAEQDELVGRMQQIDWDLRLFIPYKYRKIAQQRYGSNPHIHLVPIHLTGLPDTFAFKQTAYRLFKRGRALPIAENVMIAAIYCMMNSGYRQIELYGADHTWISQMMVDDQNRVCMVKDHYYDAHQVELKPLVNADGSIPTLSQELRCQAKAFGAYEMLQGYADYLGDVVIRNRTAGSYIDAFPR